MIIEKVNDDNEMAIVHEALYASWCLCGIFAVGLGWEREEGRDSEIVRDR